MAVSHIVLESYKKHVLVSLIVHGKVCIVALLFVLRPVSRELLDEEIWRSMDYFPCFEITLVL